MRRINHSSRFIEMFGDPVNNPKRWPVMTMKESSVLLSDGPFGSNLKSDHYSETGIRVIRLQNICQGFFDDTDKAYVSEEHYRLLQKYTCKPGDIVIGTLGEPNLRACIIPSTVPISINKADCVHYIPKPNLLNTIFACAYINSPGLLYIASSNLHGTTRSRIAAGQVNQLPIYIPAIERQLEFARFYKQADKSKFSDFKSRFIEMFGTLDSPKVPVKRMIEVSKASGQYGLNASAVNYIEGKPRYIRITDICDDGSLNDDIKCSDIDDSTYSVNKGDVLFARTGATVGKTYLHRSGDACFAGYLIRYSFTEAVDPEYILAYTHSDTYYDWVLKSQKVGAQPNISASQYDNMPILIPGRKEQEAFLCLYRQADKSKYLN